MKLELTFPLRLQSENDVRRLMPMARAGVVKRVRDGVRKALDATGWGAPQVVHGTTITITRISPGYLDDDGAVGAAKPARDGVADWLGIDDRDARVEWRVLQAGCPRGHFGTRVTIEDATDRPDREYVAQGAPARVGGALARPVERMAKDVPNPRTVALVSEEPRRPDDVTGGDTNTMAIVETCSRAHLVVAAWGADARSRERAREVSALLRGVGHKLHCLGLSKDGHPRHPLYTKGDSKPVEFAG